MKIPILSEENAKFCAGCNACVSMCEQKCIKKQGRGQPPIFDLKNCIGCGRLVLEINLLR